MKKKSKFILILFEIKIIITYSFLFYLKSCLGLKKDMWHHGPRVNRIHRIIFSTMYNFFLGNSLGWNKEVKCARAGVVLVQRKRYNTTKDFVEYNLMNIFFSNVRNGHYSARRQCVLAAGTYVLSIDLRGGDQRTRQFRLHNPDLDPKQQQIQFDHQILYTAETVGHKPHGQSTQ
jgi:hypothetical protein